MIDVVIYVSSALLTTYSALVQLGNCEVQHCFVNKCKTKENLGHSSVSLDRGEQDTHCGDKLISSE